MMNDLMNIYPNSLLNPPKSQAINKQDYYLISEGENKLYIPITPLNKKEKTLLKLLSTEQEVSQQPSALEKMLNQGLIEESLEGQKVQLVHLKVKYLDATNKELWTSTLIDSMPKIIDSQLLSDQLVVLLLRVEDEEQSILTQLEEITRSLDQDFNLFTQGMLGQMSYLNRQIKNIFTYEHQLFESLLEKDRIEGITSISGALLRQIGLALRDEKPDLPQLENYLNNKVEIKELIQRLFKNQGNLSQTAEELFIHRNTLAYRMKQFNEETAFDLSDFSDLIVCYLLIL